MPMWTLQAGIVATDPGPGWHPDSRTRFDPSPPGIQPDDDIIHKAAHVLGNLMRAAAGTCSGICQYEVLHTASLHLRAQRVGRSKFAAAAVVQAVSRFYALHTGRLEGAASPPSSGIVVVCHKLQDEYALPAGCNLTALNDTTTAAERVLARKLDARFQAGVDALDALRPAYEVIIPVWEPSSCSSIQCDSSMACLQGMGDGSGDAHSRLLEDGSTKVPAVDRALTAAASAIARSAMPEPRKTAEYLRNRRSKFKCDAGEFWSWQSVMQRRQRRTSRQQLRKPGSADPMRVSQLRCCMEGAQQLRQVAATVLMTSAG